MVPTKAWASGPMLYHIYDMHHTMLSPLRLAAEAMQHFYSHPFVPAAYTRAGFALRARMQRGNWSILWLRRRSGR